ncbi:MAG: DUF4268 domain-containing protein [Euryarchaeota archaeon]|nr:DUF4268 domain-containing protein [Euryarchaeota archaeon]
MDFIDEMKTLSARIPEQFKHVKTEEATKNALILPFIRTLGYDHSNLREVVPEYTCDFAEKQGKKVDYAIMKDGKPFMLFECKFAHDDLQDKHAAQLYHYFPATDARFAVLTNGVVYKFYTDLEKSNIMDEKPFLEFDVRDVDKITVEELKAYGKESSVGIDELHKRANELKYSKKVKEFFEEQLDSPSDDFVNFFIEQVSGKKAKKIKNELNGITRDALKEVIAKKGKPVPPPPPPVIDIGDGVIGIKEVQLEFWDGFKAYVQSTSTSLKLTQKTRPQSWYAINLKGQKAQIYLSINTQSNVLTCEIYISNSKELYNELSKYKDEIEGELNEELKWKELPTKNASRIEISKDGDIRDPGERKEQFKWLKTQAELFQEVFPKYSK